ncbi:Sec-independent protein translocase subunit TatA [Galactobacter valiniphilus]|uniref:Sec-independent protein translocase subunit TatA n=1 Tax=Galactobacter valiniphilus TaxID=2676122 RepID=UPI0037363D3D
MHMPSATAWIIIIVLVLLLFAAPKLPKLARSLGQSMRIFKSEMKQMKDDDKPAQAPTSQGENAESPVEGRIIDEGQQGPRA